MSSRNASSGTPPSPPPLPSFSTIPSWLKCTGFSIASAPTSFFSGGGVSSNRFVMMAQPDSASQNKVSLAIVSPLAVTPLPTAVGNRAYFALLPLNVQLEAEKEGENMFTEAVYDEDLLDLDGGRMSENGDPVSAIRVRRGLNRRQAPLLGKRHRHFGLR
ncbi:unnamed protein product [Agarophyton chilense]